MVNKQNNDRALWKPVTCGVILTRRCDMHCSYCDVPNKTNCGELTTSQWKKAFRIIETLGVINLTLIGGEPLLYPNITDLIHFLKEQTALSFSLITNGLNKKNRILQALDAGLPTLSVSIDSLDLSKSISPKKTKAGLEIIKLLRDSSQHQSVNIKAYCVINAHNLNDLVCFATSMSQRGIFTYFLPFHWSTSEQYEHRKAQSTLSITSPEQVARLEEEIMKIRELKRNGALIGNSDTFLAMIPRYIQRLDWHCSGLSELRLDSNGSLMCCCDRRGMVHERYSIFDLENPITYEAFLTLREQDASCCSGCLWPSSVESELKNRTISNKADRQARPY